ncbi:ThuA domain-containing protein [Rubritalea marina]|uniref:ThuA domain-containing protein n=1 Tax=Rubritalea marina TaxID=361055 RepID=UPI00035CFBAC|nr:ThuA domain-containing protein [Rubritalea marina]
MRVLTLSICVVLFGAQGLLAQHRWQQPKKPIPLAQVQDMIGPVEVVEPSCDLNILWVWGYDRPHAPGNHDYTRVRDLMSGLLASVPRCSVETVYEFPSAEQFEAADAICFYLHLPPLSDAQYQQLRQFIKDGGAVMAIHESMIMRPTNDGKRLCECFGAAWDEGRSKWGALFADVEVKKEHPIFRGFPDTIRLVDEFYWDLHQQSEGVDVIGEVRAGPTGHSRKQVEASKLSVDRHPVFWTYSLGEGRVFATSAGHNTFSYYDPEFRLILFRGLAWALRQKADPWMPLVTEGITKDGMVGTTDDMRDWGQKPRGPKK